jgi:hypothetical protein
MTTVEFEQIVKDWIIWRQYRALATATWYAAPTVEGSKLSFAGMWHGYLSLPLFQSLLLRLRSRAIVDGARSIAAAIWWIVFPAWRCRQWYNIVSMKAVHTIATPYTKSFAVGP